MAAMVTAHAVLMISVHVTTESTAIPPGQTLIALEEHAPNMQHG
jgi:hypothetical protein